MKSFFAVLSATFILGSLGACSSDEGDDDAGGSSTSSSSSSSGANGTSSSSSSSSGSNASGSSSSGSSNSTACKGKTPDSAAIKPVVTGDPAPAATGGTLEDGTYQLTAVNVYGGDPVAEAVNVKITLTIDGTSYVRAYSVSGAGRTFTGSDSGTYTIVSGAIVAAQQCEDGDEDNGFGGFDGTYSYAAGVLKVYDEVPVGDAGTIEYIATKQ